jgi:superfamily II DNA/RNA helicase
LDALLANLLDDSADHPTKAAPQQATVAAQPTGPQFTDLGLHESLIRALKDSGYTNPTEVQLQAIPAAMAGRDVRVASSTGSGKTAAFMLPALERIAAARGDDSKRREKGKVHGPRVLVLTPTRELALQVAEAACTYGRHMQGLRVATVVGGVPYGYQLKALRGPLDVLIATPGRLIDHLRSGVAVLSNLEVLVLDEADRMLDMGFIEDIETIAEHTPAERQTMMFSATFAGHVGKLAERLTRQAQHIEVTSHTDSHDNIEQRLHLADTLSHKNDLLDHLLTTKEVNQAVVFTSTQRDADILADRLADMGHAVAALHGGMPQGRRNRVLQGLRSGELRVLVATDVAARGIDVPTITHVINYGMPMKPEDYVHRIGRTGRAGRSGLAVTLAERRDIPMLRRIERYTTQRIPESVIAGLEPRTKMQADRPGPRSSKPMPGQRGPRDDRWSAPRSGGGYSNDGPRAPRQDSYDRAAPRDFQPSDARFRGANADSRGPSFDRGADNRPDTRAKKPWDAAPKPFAAKPSRPASSGPSGPGNAFGKRAGYGKRAA